MKIYFLILFIFSFVNSGLSQNPNLDYSGAFKIYNTSSFSQSTYTIPDSSVYSKKSTYSNLQIFHPTIAFQWKTKKNNFHEVELTDFSFNRSSFLREEILDSTGAIIQTLWAYKSTSSFVSARYEFIVVFNKSKDKKIVPTLGFAIRPYFKQSDFSPQISNVYPVSGFTLGMGGYLIPGISYYLSSRIFLNLSLPINIFDSSFKRSHFEDPTLTQSQQTVYSFESDMFPGIYYLRFGVGIKL